MLNRRRAMYLTPTARERERLRLEREARQTRIEQQTQARRSRLDRRNQLREELANPIRHRSRSRSPFQQEESEDNRYRNSSESSRSFSNQYLQQSLEGSEEQENQNLAQVLNRPDSVQEFSGSEESDQSLQPPPQNIEDYNIEDFKRAIILKILNVR